MKRKQHVSLKSMGQTICYWRGSAEAREDLLSAITGGGIQVLHARGLEEVLDHVARHPIELIVIDGSASQREASDRIVEITNTELLHSIPTVFVSVQAGKRIAGLKGRHALIYPIDIPYRLPNVIRGLELLMDSAAPMKAEEFLAIINAAEAAPAAETVPEVESAFAPAADVDASVDSFTAALEEAFHDTQSADVAAVVADVVHALETESAPAVESAAAAAPEPAAAEAAEPEAARLRQTVEDTSAENRERLQGSRDPDALEKSLGGEVFALGSHFEDFDDGKLVPGGEKSAQFHSALAELTARDAWNGIHARRSAFVASAMANQLSFSKVQKDSVRLVCLFINWAESEGSLKTRRQDALQESNRELLDEMAEAFRESAAMIEQRLGEARAARTAELAAQLLIGDRSLTAAQKELLLEAECVLVVELSGRACWGQGHWSPSGAYRAIRNFRREDGVASNRKVRAAVIRIVGEGVTRHVTVGNVFIPIDDVESTAVRSSALHLDRKGSGQPASGASGRKIRSVTVQLAELEPGMRLAAPLNTRDGKTILEADTVMNEKLLFSLFQLAAVRAVNNEVSVQAEV